jgi:hypothetical protein
VGAKSDEKNIVLVDVSIDCAPVSSDVDTVTVFVFAS